MRRSVLVVVAGVLFSIGGAVQPASAAPIALAYQGVIDDTAGLPSFSLGQPASLLLTVDVDTDQLLALSATFNGVTYAPRPDQLPGTLSPVLPTWRYASFTDPAGPAVDGMPPFFLNLYLDIGPGFPNAQPMVFFGDGSDFGTFVAARGLQPVSTPEPATWLLIGAGLTTLSLARRRTRDN
jgi:hypothetical protein